MYTSRAISEQRHRQKIHRNKQWLGIILVILLPVIVLNSASAEQQLALDLVATPSWVSPLENTNEVNIPAEQVDNGAHHLIYDQQIRIHNTDKPSYFFYHGIKIFNEEGLEDNAQVNISIDPSYETLHFHQLFVMRDGKRISLEKNVRYSLLQREKDLEKLIYDGSKTANLILNDIRVGDELHYSYSINGDNPILDPHFSYSSNLIWGVPVSYQRLSVHWHKDTPLYSRVLNAKPADYPITRIQTAQGTTHSITQTQLPAKLSDSETPNWYQARAVALFSNTKEWREIVDWAIPLYSPAYNNASSSQKNAAEIKLSSNTDAEKISNALQRVQNDIRYLGLEMGSNSHKPSPPNTTWERRWGDCKDKTVALISLLDELGFEAYPALVNTKKKHTLNDYGPAVNLFNHVIVALEYQGDTYWLDPTLRFQTGLFPNIYQPHYGLALKIKAGENALSEIPETQPVVNQQVTEIFTLDKNTLVDIKHQVHTNYQGRSAEYFRETRASDSQQRIEKSYIDFYEGYYPKIRTAQSIQINDDPIANTIESNESYFISDLWKKDEEENTVTAWFYFSTLYSYLAKPENQNRQSPLAWSHPVDLTSVIHIDLPSDNWSFTNEQQEISNELFSLNFEVVFDAEKRRLTLSNHLQTHIDYIPTDKIDLYLSSREEALNLLSYGLYKTLDSQTNSSLSVSQIEQYSLRVILLLGFIIIAIGLSITGLILWLAKGDKPASDEEAIFYPVSPIKFIAMNIITIQLYTVYWMYKNWMFVKNFKPIEPQTECINNTIDIQQTNNNLAVTDTTKSHTEIDKQAELDNKSNTENDTANTYLSHVANYVSDKHIFPIWRAIFSIFWFIPFGLRLQQTIADAGVRLSGIHFSTALVWLLGIAYLAIEVIDPDGDYLLYTAILQVVIYMPILLLVNKLNGNDSRVYIRNSRFHYWQPFAIPLALMLYATNIPGLNMLTPSAQVIGAENIPKSHIQFMQRKKILPIEEKIELFYGSGILDWQADGNGFTQKSVFSYWKDDSKFNVERAEFKDIKAIYSQPEASDDETTIVKVELDTGGHIILYVATKKDKDKLFLEQLKANWQAIREAPNNSK